MLRIYHVSDLHFHGKQEKNQGPIRLLNNVWRMFMAGDTGNSYLLVTGDISDDSEEDQYEQAIQALRPFADLGKLLVVGGNHDAAWQGAIYSGHRERRFDDHFLKPLGIQHSFLQKDPAASELADGEGTEVLAIGLSSIRQTEDSWDLAVGEVGRKQLQALDDLLGRQEYEGHWRLVYLHHRPHKIKLFHLGMYLTDARELMQIVKDRADVLAFGHEGGLRSDEEHARYDEALAVESDGRPYLLNANSSVKRNQCIVIQFDGIRSTIGEGGLRVRVRDFDLPPLW
jgi:predicted MPP superfamily phosphohydrolase